MNQREKMRRSQEEAQSELQAHCLFCKHTVVKRDRAQDGIKAIHLLDTTNLLKASGLKDSDMTKTNQLQLPSLHAAQDAGRRSERTEAPRKLSKLTRSEEEKVEKAADQIATLMGSGSHDSSDVDKEMAKMQSRGTSWKALWSSGLKTSSASVKARFQYLAGRPDDRMESNLDDPLSAKTAANPFGDNFHY